METPLIGARWICLHRQEECGIQVRNYLLRRISFPIRRQYGAWVVIPAARAALLPREMSAKVALKRMNFIFLSWNNMQASFYQNRGILNYAEDV